MTRRLMQPMPEAIERSQRTASDPARSVWVTANAGSGKTYVLTSRVLRLLLSGVPPEQILCLTYTKAAAAEMRGRVAERLSRWALADEAALQLELTGLTGSPPTPGQLLRARTLFAHALETPGGLKIQTIHAFCEAVLHRFPKEAGVPFDFSVIEDFERDAMLLQARERVLSAGLRGGETAGAVETLFGLLSDFQIETGIVEALGRQRLLRRVLSQRGIAKTNLRRVVGVAGGPLREDVLTRMAQGYGPSAQDHAAVFALIPPSRDGDEFADRLARIDPRHPDIDAMREAYLTDKGTARKTLLKKATAALIPEIAARLEAEAARLERLTAELTRAELVERSEAMLDIIAAISDRYEAQKRASSLLDFDDLVERLRGLLSDEHRGAWVRYKLDSRISHVLVDEGQDTNPQQWEVVSALIAEFFFGESAADRPRTLFVVGDQKQSIFSFQGADPDEFVTLGRQVYYTAQAVKFEIAPVRLRHSFRTLPKVLEGVDRVFARPDLQLGVLEDDAVLHQTARAETGGHVTLWPPIKEIEDETDPDNWATEPPKIQTQSAPRRVAERIARQIKGWLRSGRPLGPRRRPVTADDVLILVQVRSVLFHEIIRALIREGIQTPGADRLAVTTHIGALDLMALGDVLSNPADDLQLAALLRSPLFDVSEADLYAVAQPRDEGTWLWTSMERSSIPSVKAASEALHKWRGRLDFERPFNFYTDVLYREGGLKKFHARFGSEIDDVVAEFLDLALAHEQSPQPSLLGFLAELRSREVTIKRELGEVGSGVRVMTVHGAKGLEAPIVILADAATTEAGRDRRAIFMTDAPLFFHASSKETHVAETMEHRDLAEAAQKQEYWRKLYVAMTRAEDELYVTGALTKTGKLEGTWYEAIEQALRPLSRIETDAEGNETALVFPAQGDAAGAATSNVAAIEPAVALILDPLPKYTLRRIVRPSMAAADADPETALDSAVERLADRRDPGAARREGIALHALLQHLAALPPASWEAVIDKALPVLLPDSPDERTAIGSKARSILGRAELAHLFGPNSRAEVPILAQGRRKGEPVTIAGRIDRLVVTPEKVLVVDFKSDALPPADAGKIPPAYVLQLGLYARIAGQLFPGHLLEAVILWTALESLMILPPQALSEAVGDFTIG
jgi:ATP-dependent helicase/nuclease subunit A